MISTKDYQYTKRCGKAKKTADEIGVSENNPISTMLKQTAGDRLPGQRLK